MTKPTTTIETFNKQYPLALAALAEHMQTHGLPAPRFIDVVDDFDAGRLDRVIRIYLPGEHTHQPWVTSVCVDGEAVEPAASGLGVRTEWTVRLPDTGFRFQLVGFTHHRLQAVPA